MDKLAQQLAAATAELRAAGEEARAQQELIASLVQGRLAEQLTANRLTAAIPVGVLDTDGAGTVLRANPAAAALLGLDADELRGKPLFAFVEPADRRTVRTALARAAAGTGSEQLVARVARRDAPVRVELAVLPVAAPRSAIGQPVPAARWVLAREVAADPDQDTLTALAELASLPVLTGDLPGVLVRAAGLAVRGVTPAAAAGVTIGAPAEPTLLANTDTLAQATDGAQLRARQGPSWVAFGTPGPVATTDLRADPRWPGLAPLLPASAAGAVAVPLLDGTVPIGVLTVYGTSAVGTAEQRTRVTLFAALVTRIVREHRAVEGLRRAEVQLRDALVSRATIDQAKGVLMARHGYDADQAFAELTRRSQRADVTLRDLAQMLVTEAAGGASSGQRPPASAVRPIRPTPT